MLDKNRIAVAYDPSEPDPRWDTLVVLDTDYTDYGGKVERWADNDKAYPDCSCGCVWWDDIDFDWGTCRKPGAPRENLLTWEHQTGGPIGPGCNGCYEDVDSLADRMRALMGLPVRKGDKSCAD